MLSHCCTISRQQAAFPVRQGTHPLMYFVPECPSCVFEAGRRWCGVPTSHSLCIHPPKQPKLPPPHTHHHRYRSTLLMGHSPTHQPTHAVPHNPPTVCPQAASSSAGCDPVAAQIGAVNTLIRQQQQQPSAGSSDGGSSSSSKTSWRGYNTDWLAAISAIERVLAAGSSDAAAVTSSSGSNGSSGSSGSSESVLKGKTVCVVGAGGAGRALAFGAASKGAKVIIANRCVCVVVRWCFMGVMISTVLRGLLEVTATSVSAAVESGSKGAESCWPGLHRGKVILSGSALQVFLEMLGVGLRSCCLDRRWLRGCEETAGRFWNGCLVDLVRSLP